MRPKPPLSFLLWLLIRCCCGVAAQGHKDAWETERTSVRLPAQSCSVFRIQDPERIGDLEAIISVKKEVPAGCDLASNFKIKSVPVFDCTVRVVSDTSLEWHTVPLHASSMSVAFKVPLVFPSICTELELQSNCTADIDAWLRVMLDDHQPADAPRVGACWYDGEALTPQEFGAGYSRLFGPQDLENGTQDSLGTIVSCSLTAFLALFVGIWKLRKLALAEIEEDNLLDGVQLLPQATITADPGRGPAEETPDPLSDKQAFLNL